MAALLKKCSKCGTEKPLDDFNNQKLGKYGKRASCKACQNLENSNYKKTEKAIELRRLYKKSEKGIATNKRYRDNNKDKIKDYTNTEIYRMRHRQSSDIQRFGGNRKIVLERDNHECVVCGSTESIQVHHKDETGRNKPRCEQNNDLDNLITLCSKCHILQHNPVSKRWNKQ